MKKNEKILIAVLIIIAILAIVFVVNKNNSEKQVQMAQEQPNTETQQTNTTVPVLENVKNLGNGTSLNTSSQLNKEKEYNGIKISDIQLTLKGNKTELLINAKNTTDTATEFQMLKLKFIDKDGNELQTIGCAIKSLEPGEITQTSATASSNFINAYDFTISK